MFQFKKIFVRHPYLPVDLIIFGIDGQINHDNHSQYVEKWRRSMTEAYELACQARSPVEKEQGPNNVMTSSYKVQ